LGKTRLFCCKVPNNRISVPGSRRAISLPRGMLAPSHLRCCEIRQRGRIRWKFFPESSRDVCQSPSLARALQKPLATQLPAAEKDCHMSFVKAAFDYLECAEVPNGTCGFGLSRQMAEWCRSVV